MVEAKTDLPSQNIESPAKSDIVRDPYPDSRRPLDTRIDFPVLQEPESSPDFRQIPNDSKRPNDYGEVGINIPNIPSEVISSVQHMESSEKNETAEETSKHQEEIEGKMHYYDDNGNLYRIDNDLIPNNTYEINGYKYETDDKGRIISAEGKLHQKNHEGRLPIKDSIEDIGKGDQKEGDDRGHLIGDQFDGSNGLENMIPQDADINQKDFRNFENELAKCVKDGKEVTVKVEPVYDGDSRRPSAIIVTYTIDGEESVRVFPNGTEGK